MTRHRPRVVRWQEETSQGLAWCYRMQCPCGVEADEYYAKALADGERQDHIEALGAPPEHERCRDPQRHRTRQWESCPLCADQMALPGL